MAGSAGYFHKIADALAAASCCGKIHAEFPAFWRTVANDRACSRIPSDAGLQSMMYTRRWGDKLWTLKQQRHRGTIPPNVQRISTKPDIRNDWFEKALKMIEAGSSAGGK
jgi:hypothetical protein